MALTISLGIWRGLVVFLLFVVLTQFYWIFSAPGSQSVPIRNVTPSRPQAGTSTDEEWTYKPERDASNPGLSIDQCDAAFPNNNYEIDRAVKHWQNLRHTITQEDVQVDWRRDAMLRLLIHDNQLRVLEAKGAWNGNSYSIRTFYTLLQIHRALLGAFAAGEPVPNIEFSVCVDDMSLLPNKKDDTHAVWAYTRRIGDQDQERSWLVPDFNFYAAPNRSSSWADSQRRAKKHDEVAVMDKIRKAVWRGAVWTNQKVRGSLMDVTEGKPWADVLEVVWKEKLNIMRAEDFCRYMFVIHTEGRSWSGRLKYLLNCDSVPIVHKLDWTTSYYHLLVGEGPDQNHIPVKRDFSDMEAKVNYYLDNADEAQRIAENSVATFRSRYTSPAAEACYWRRLMRSWSTVAFVPDPYETVDVDVSGLKEQEQQVRGKPVEDFM